MSKYFQIFVIMAATWIFPTLVHAAEGMPTECTVKNRSEAIVVVVCQPALDQAVWSKAGRQACGPRTKCNAWIWDDAKKAPDVAPLADANLTAQQSASAVAVWANDSQSLLLIKSVNKAK